MIISGGQTGVDRGALDAAIKLNFPHGGYCPKGRKAEDGRIPDRYQLVETVSCGYTEQIGSIWVTSHNDSIRRYPVWDHVMTVKKDGNCSVILED